MVLNRSILDLTLPVTELLQGKEIDMVDVSHLLDSMKSVILSKRNTVDEFHNNCHRIIREITIKVSINETKPRTAAFNETKPRTAAFQKNRNNVLSESISDYF